MQEEEMEGDGAMSLPEELVGRILAMVPFPFVFKARALSKCWLARLSPISPEDSEEARRLAASFQKQVAEHSSNRWTTFCPIFLRNEDFIAYDLASQHWRRMPLPSFLPRHLFLRSDWWRLEGALLLVSTSPDIGSGPGMFSGYSFHRANAYSCPDYNFYVANLLTRSWKQLPPRPHAVDERTHIGEKWLIHMSLEAYKVVVFDEYIEWRSGHCFAEIYDSELGVWTGKKFLISEDDGVLSNWAYLNGVFYRAVGPVHLTEKPTGVLAFNAEEQSFQILQLASIDIAPSRWDLVELAVCSGNLLMVVYDGYDGYSSVESLIVLKIDLGSRRWSEVTRGPPAATGFGKFAKKPASSGDCLFFVGSKVDSGILAYNMQEDQWSCFPMPASVSQSYSPFRIGIKWNAPGAKFQWEPSSFQPGLNPFVAV